MKQLVSVFLSALLLAGLSFGAFAQDKVTQQVLELGRSDNRTILQM